ncbi:MAG: permease [candidate division KSB1 bacterium]|nr:permease [candidate division KSB1 bacterium]MDZ7294958.1 permease [candidate division KSB1 bacterium]MDZ7384733.1 permease [candidate division KSB1 bacterium]MDZ7392303.1 permease [candidate division KSB1 bacterium]MDZ7412208.1 permease [candidate division KSB1 bacterium]
MDWKKEWRALLGIVAVFLLCFYLPVGTPRFDGAVTEALHLVRWYAREHVLMCLIPAFFIAGAIAVFVSKESVMRYLGPKANRVLAYGVASVSGSILAVCSCTVLPLFAGIYRMGAGLGPATTFLYSGPAINVLAIVLTARILGLPLGIARAFGAVLFSVVIGLLMHLLFRKEETAKQEAQMLLPTSEPRRPLWRTAVFFASMVVILVFANWGKPTQAGGFWAAVYEVKWWITGFAATALGAVLVAWFDVAWRKVAVAAAATVLASIVFGQHPIVPFGVGVLGLSITASRDRGEAGEWFVATWGYAKQILPLLFFGVLVAGALLGRPGHEGLIPSRWVASLVGGNSLGANFFASVVGAFMYFATLTEVPILQGLIGSGMGQGPALALLLAGPALSLPSMLVIHSIMGTKRTLAFILLVVVMAALTGLLFGTVR